MKKFRVIEVGSWSEVGSFNIGDVVDLNVDDGTSMKGYIDKNGNTAWIADSAIEAIKSSVNKDEREASYLVVAAKQGVMLPASLRAEYIANIEAISRAEERKKDANKEIAERQKENDALREKLRAMGFDFWDAPKEPEANVSDPRNWRVGDVIKLVDPELGDVGEIAIITEIKGNQISKKRANGSVTTHMTDSDHWEFHSRPSK